jgi:UDP-N-acetylmuramoylalanine--D-glutamate ligase
VSRVLVLGAGVSGLAAAKLARRVGLNPSLYAEQGSAEALNEGFGVAAGDWDPVLLNGVDLVVASPGFSERSRPIVESLEWGIPVWSEIEFASRHLVAPLIAVTGTNGKTTVTEATSAMLESSGMRAPAAGNIGCPLSDRAGGDYDALVVEVSSFQLRFTESFHPTAAAITNVAIDHLDWHGSADSYRSAKARIYANQGPGDLLVYDADDDGASSLATAAKSDLFPVSGSRLPRGGGGIVGGNLVIGATRVSLSDLGPLDPVYLVNLALSASLALRSGASPEAVESTARSFRWGDHRRQVVASSHGVTWVDDSKATNPHAAIASIRSNASVVLIAGGLGKGLDVVSVAKEPNVRHLIGIGTMGPELVAAAGGRGHLAGDLQTAVRLAAELAVAGDVVLLAPACASFDQFESYAQRGEVFADLVANLTGVESA